ncbi:acetyl-CoA C-acetyltransferase [Rhizobium leguminosarum]|uniref:Acetyl-CoA C-acetyltransferase n=3 Tax=Rhizobium leguminosarum TaxID=384 RepID=A0A7X0DWA1_RHILE|nr:thiolase family protein [Rhizobium leguminosarum]ACI57928.1 acetyl-CoA acetyltransferase [Rhizobium leguminosarum bv. trifolii WSM2304]EJB06710.1 acetyl-CoA acetyltransferase [Rhizobium leguminosarum bv. trifolii WSM597]MBB5661893.1 acetyl-CoA C-acetyltransferase [Rhizobium leguminosarum]MBB6225565.1 acetyl-CoA C-acetyltransferase [Rhizobium leguminosarum]NYJ13365.1 acetyl-CoA C-acetyltransferase [Rhizobium leguminosarum]
MSYAYQPDEDWQPVVVAAYRTPIGRAFGSLATVAAEDLLAPIIRRIVAESGVAPEAIDDVLVGNAAGGGGNIGRLAALTAGLPVSVPGVAVDRQCGSGLEAIIMAARLIQAKAGACFLAGGVESVSTAPWRVERPKANGALPRFYGRARFSPEAVGDPEMGIAAENVARQFAITRQRQDEFALRSHRLAVAAAEAGLFRPEIVGISTSNGLVDRDECPRPSTSFEALANLRPVFLRDGSVTAGNACPLNDGACLVLVMSRGMATSLGIGKGLAFIDSAAAGVDPNLLGIGPVASTKKLLQRQPGLSLADVDAIEFNEAFAAQVLASLDQLDIPADRVNSNGGAIALGHPFGASGAILVTRLYTQLIRKEAIGATSLAMIGIAGGLGLTALFEAVVLS